MNIQTYTYSLPYCISCSVNCFFTLRTFRVSACGGHDGLVINGTSLHLPASEGPGVVGELS